MLNSWKQVLKYKDFKKRFLMGALGAVVLLLVFLFQKLDYLTILSGFLGIGGGVSQVAVYLFNKIVRFFVNDLMTLLIIHAVFYRRKYLTFAIYVQVFGMIFLLLPYLILKLYFPNYDGPLLSHLHRLTLNPMLLMLLIPALLYQAKKEGKAG